MCGLNMIFLMHRKNNNTYLFFQIVKVDSKTYGFVMEYIDMKGLSEHAELLGQQLAKYFYILFQINNTDKIILDAVTTFCFLKKRKTSTRHSIIN